MIPDLRDFTIRWPGHPKYKSTRILEDDNLEVITQKLEMILFTNQGELFGDDNFGANLEYYLWSTNMSNNTLKENVSNQIATYIPELALMGYTFNLKLFEGNVRDIMYLNFEIQGQNVEFLFR